MPYKGIIQISAVCVGKGEKGRERYCGMCSSLRVMEEKKRFRKIT